MRQYLTKGLVLLLSLTLLLTACGAPRPAPSQSRETGGESASSPVSEELEEKPDSQEPSPDSELPASSPAPREEAPESLPAEDPGGESGASVAAPEEETPAVTEDGWYNTKNEVAEYIHLYNRLPGNYKTKKEAQAAGWSGGNVERYTGQGTAIGGDRFGNREGLLPKAKGRQYTECDIDTVGRDSRGAKRIIFSNDGLVYYTEDHYNTFEQLYGDE